MQYHIQTAPIWDAYKNSGCPLCALKAARQTRLVTQYLTDNVMDPDFRVASNDRGFCAEHIKQMYAGQNKLGLALQLETRAAALCELLGTAPTDKKSAKKTAAKLDAHRGCVICDALSEVMPRYYITVAEMFGNEKDFPELFGSARHCLKHTQDLYSVAEYAGKAATAYLFALTQAIKRDLAAVEKELKDFADCFDFKSGGRPDQSALSRAIELLN